MTVELEKIRAKDYDEQEYKNCGSKDSPCVICGKTIKNYMTLNALKSKSTATVLQTREPRLSATLRTQGTT